MNTNEDRIEVVHFTDKDIQGDNDNDDNNNDDMIQHPGRLDTMSSINGQQR